MSDEVFDWWSGVKERFTFPFIVYLVLVLLPWWLYLSHVGVGVWLKLPLCLVAGTIMNFVYLWRRDKERWL